VGNEGDITLDAFYDKNHLKFIFRWFKKWL